MPSFLKVSKAAGAASPSFLKPGVAHMLTVFYFVRAHVREKNPLGN